MLVGAAEDSVEQPTLVGAKAHMDLARLAGLNAIRSTAIWAPGQTEAGRDAADGLKNAAAAAKLDGIALLVSVYQFGSKTTPLTDQDQVGLRRLRRSAREGTARPSASFVIGNEPNINRFWLPQFNLDGTDAAAPAYESLLAQDLRRDQGGRPGRAGARRRRLTARRRQPERGPAHSFADSVHRRHGRGVPRERPH